MKRATSKWLIPVIFGSLLLTVAAIVWFTRWAKPSVDVPVSSAPVQSQSNASSSEPQTQEEYVAYIPNDSLSVAGLRLGMSSQQVVAVLGKPQKETKGSWKIEAPQSAELGQPEGTIAYQQFWDYPGISITLINYGPSAGPKPSDPGHLSEIVVKTTDYRTSDGLGIGDELKKVQSALPARTDFDEDLPGSSKVTTALFTASGGVIKGMKFCLDNRTYVVYVENEDYQIAGCCLGDTDDKVLSVLGPPLNKELSEERDLIGIKYGADEKSMLYSETWTYPNAKLVFYNGGLSTEPRPADPGRLDSIVISGSGLTTQSGVRIGDSFEKVKWIYRQREGVTPDDEGYVMGAVALSFVIRDGVVANIEAYVSTD